MRIQTRGNSTTVWLSSDEGVIVGTMTMSAPTLEKILQAVNEKYGTSFEGWSQLPTAYEVGGTVPNWEAYEKIELPQIYLWSSSLPGRWFFVFGKVVNGVLTVYADTGQSLFEASSRGEISGTYAISIEDFEQIIRPRLEEKNVEFESVVVDTTTYKMSDEVPNWNEYNQIA